MQLGMLWAIIWTNGDCKLQEASWQTKNILSKTIIFLKLSSSQWHPRARLSLLRAFSSSWIAIRIWWSDYIHIWQLDMGIDTKNGVKFGCGISPHPKAKLKRVLKFPPKAHATLTVNRGISLYHIMLSQHWLAYMDSGVYTIAQIASDLPFSRALCQNIAKKESFVTPKVPIWIEWWSKRTWQECYIGGNILKMHIDCKIQTDRLLIGQYHPPHIYHSHAFISMYSVSILHLSNFYQ